MKILRSQKIPVSSAEAVAVSAALSVIARFCPPFVVTGLMRYAIEKALPYWVASK
jgi:hypothetical protein